MLAPGQMIPGRAWFVGAGPDSSCQNPSSSPGPARAGDTGKQLCPSGCWHIVMQMALPLTDVFWAMSPIRAGWKLDARIPGRIQPFSDRPGRWCGPAPVDPDPVSAARVFLNSGDGRTSAEHWVSAFLKLFLTGAVMAAAIGIAMHFQPKRKLAQTASFVAFLVGGSLLANLLLGLWAWANWAFPPWTEIVSGTVYWSVLAGYLFLLDSAHTQALQQAAAVRRLQVAKATLQRQLAATRLQVLEAQIEPHFLFNTLANLKRVFRLDRDKGDAALANLMIYLNSALPRMRQPTATIAEEAELTRAYLELFSMRMGHRLRFVIQMDPRLTGVQMPTMMLLTLVENAIKHGLMPSEHGGTIRIVARREQGCTGSCCGRRRRRLRRVPRPRAVALALPISRHVSWQCTARMLVLSSRVSNRAASVQQFICPVALRPDEANNGSALIKPWSSDGKLAARTQFCCSSVAKAVDPLYQVARGTDCHHRIIDCRSGLLS